MYEAARRNASMSSRVQDRAVRRPCPESTPQKRLRGGPATVRLGAVVSAGGREWWVVGVALVALLGCDEGTAAAPRELRIVAGPRDTPLVASLELELAESGELRVHVDDGERGWSLQRPVEAAEPLTVPLLGLRFDSVYRIELELCTPAGRCRALAEPLEHQTPERPPHLPPVIVHRSEPERMEPGWTLLILLASGDLLVPTPWSALMALDADGEVVWYHEVDGWIGDHAFMGERVVYSVGNVRLQEIDLLGTVHERWRASGQGVAGAHPDAVLLDVDTLHHELIALDSDDDAAFLALDTERRSFEDYPGDEVTLDPVAGTTEVVSDVVVEFDRDGAVIRRWSLFDVLDPRRLGYDALIDFWAPVYGPGTRDWSHANAVTLTPERDAYLVSLRHQDAIVKLDRATGALSWIFGDPARWDGPWRDALLDVAWREDPEAGEYAYHQHAPSLTADGDILLFDNGVQRAVPPAEPLPEPERYSRAVQYAIDEQAARVEQRWAFSGPEGGMYARIVGDADELPTTSHVLVTSGAQEDPERRTSWARLFEVTRDEPAEILFDVQIGERDADPGTQWVVYRAERIAELR